MKLNPLKVTVVMLAVIIVLLIAVLLWWPKNQKPITAAAMVADYKNLTYVIEGQEVTLKDGYFEIPTAPGSASKVITRYFGNEAFGDVNADGTQDAIFLLTQETGGSGTFYYATGVLQTGTGYHPLNTIFLGDRIAPQATQIKDGAITINYADRNQGEPMTTAPSMGVSKYFKVTKGNLVKYIPAISESAFENPITLTLHQQVKLTDGLVIFLQAIDDSHCDPRMVCVWAGELSPVLDISGGSVGAVAQEVRLGISTAKKVTKNGYTFELKNATETSATIVVTK
jgi:hypothetical protein